MKRFAFLAASAGIEAVDLAGCWADAPALGMFRDTGRA
jgi:hypothetical protein